MATVRPGRVQRAVSRPATPGTGAPFFSSLEELICSPDGFGITTMSPLQRAVCRLVSGAPLAELAQHPHIAEGLGLSTVEVEGFEEQREEAGFPIPKEIFLVAGIRTFKSLLLAATAIWSSQKANVDFSGGPKAGEIPRYSIVSLTLDNAKVVLQHLHGALAQARLQPLCIDHTTLQKTSGWKDVIRDTASELVGSKFLWHPSGRPMEIRVVAGKRAGGSTVSRWSFGLGLDEATRMVGNEEGVVNYTDIRRSMLGRLVPGAQLFSVGSPWVSEGPVFDIVHEWWGQPKLQQIIIRGSGPLLNPEWWTPERCEELKEHDPVAYQMDVLGEFGEQGAALIPQTFIAQCTRASADAIPPEDRHTYVAAMDPATRGNSWSLVIGDRVRRLDEKGDTINTVKRVVLATQWTGNPITPLKPRATMREIAEVLEEYNIDWLYTDQWSADSLKDHAQEFGLSLVENTLLQDEAYQAAVNLREAMAESLVEIPNDPMVQKDLRLVRRVVNRRGPAIVLPVTTDGRHCDYAATIMQLFRHWLEEDKAPAPKYGTESYMKKELAEMRQRAYDRVRAQDKLSKEWWSLDPSVDAQQILGGVR